MKRGNMGKKSVDKGEFTHFKFALIVISLSITISSIAFMSEKKDITGFATSSVQSSAINSDGLKEFDSVKSLGILAAGNYYIDENGIVYWTEDNSNPAIAKVNSVDESQKNRRIYIDNNGNVGYSIS